jgi:hypothetical protein
MDKENFLLPDIEWPVLIPFWEACRNEELKFPRCQKCGSWQWYPTIICPDCQGEFEWAKVAPKGRLYSWTVVHKAFFPEFKEKIPFIVACIEIDDAPGVRFIANVVDCKPEDLRIGMEMDVVFEHIDDKVTKPQFRISI